MNYDQVIWNIIDTYFKENPYALVNHQLNSYERFVSEDIPTIFKQKNPIRILKNQDEKSKAFNLRCHLYLGGVNGDKIYYGKPCIYDESADPSVKQRFMYPNEARLQNMTYGMAIHYDVDVEFFIRLPNTETGELEEQKHAMTINKVYFGKFPVMLHSSYCILKDKPRELLFNLGECRNDKGGYFIVDGKEKVIISQEKFANNILYIKDKVNDLYSHSVEVRSESEDTSKPIRTTSVRRVTPTDALSNGHYVVELPNVRKAMPLFIVFRALGITSDKDILKTIFLDIEQNESYLEHLIQSIHDASIIFNQETALKYIATFTKEKTVSQVQYILSDYFLPHIGEVNYREKALYLGQMVFKLLKVVLQEEAPTDRDSFIYKRVELPGMLLKELFNEYYSAQIANIFKKFDKEYYFHTGQYQGLQFINLIMDNHEEGFKDRIVEEGFRKAFKGNWGSQSHTKRDGIVQDLQRLSFNSALSLKRKVSLPMDDSAKIVAPRLLHGSQWGYIDPVDTPDGGNVGLHKHLAITTQITNGYSREEMIKWLVENSDMIILENAKYDLCAHSIKIYINGKWVGCTLKPRELVNKIQKYRRVGCIPIMTSISWDIQHNEIHIFTDAGRMARPLCYVERNTNNILKINQQKSFELFLKGEFSWMNCIVGFNEIQNKNNAYFKGYGIAFYDPIKLYGVNSIDDCFVDGKSSVIEFIDTNESNSTYIHSQLDIFKTKKETDEYYGKGDYTHVEIHPSLMLGVMGNQIVFPNNNQLPRDLFSCGQSKQGVSLYHSNYQNRIDKTGVILNYGQIPILKSRYFKYINNEEHPYGENVIVAIMCYNAFNVEDSILINKGSIDRGLFSTTYFNSYEAYEESDKVGGKLIEKKFTNIASIQDSIVRLKAGYDYSQLDDFGVVKEGTIIDDKTIVMGITSSSADNPSIFVDNSVTPKKGQKGVVDKTFISERNDGLRLAKVRIRENRIPAVGDKLCSRCGQKGTIGSYVEEYDMPITADGIVPDIIVNPHALPSRMTIGQLIEMLSGKLGLEIGVFGDCTAFIDNGTKNEYIGSLLLKNGYNTSGNEILYNGMTGEQIEANVFFGPTYYMRLKHMVKDKINYRAQGPRTLLTRQTVQGRANDGGLRIGEMERDGIIAHGAASFLNNSLMERGDSYLVAVCNKTGMIAIVNQAQNLFLSPLLDGPLKFEGDLNSNSINVEKISKYGNDFSLIRVPYTFKLLIQELTSMNVQMRIITEDNINQLQTMTFSKNINLLLNNPRDVENEDDSNVSELIERNNMPETPAVAPEVAPEAASPYYGPPRPDMPDTPEVASPYYGPPLSETPETSEPATPLVRPPLQPSVYIEQIYQSRQPRSVPWSEESSYDETSQSPPAVLPVNEEPATQTGGTDPILSSFIENEDPLPKPTPLVNIELKEQVDELQNDNSIDNLGDINNVIKIIKK
jgi:DNA-directed RNA polymerase II subunit RPB2